MTDGCVELLNCKVLDCIEISSVNIDSGSDNSTCSSVRGVINDYLGKIGLSEFLSEDIDNMQNKNELVSYEGDSLFVASELGDAKAVERILQFSSKDVNMTDGNGSTVLHIASENGFDTVVEKILVHPDTNVNRIDKHYRFALELACEQKHFGVVKLLVNHPKICVDHVHLLFHRCCVFNELQNVVLLLEHPAIDVNKYFLGGVLPLSTLYQNGNLEIMEKLFQQTDVEVNEIRTADGVTPLYVACEDGHLEIVEKLLKRNDIQVNKATTNNGMTPLYAACAIGHVGIVEMLLKRNDIEVNKATTDHGTTPLYVACAIGYLEIVEELLLRIEIEVDKTTTDGTTALSAAQNHCFTSRRKTIVSLLSAYGAKA